MPRSFLLPQSSVLSGQFGGVREVLTDQAGGPGAEVHDIDDYIGYEVLYQVYQRNNQKTLFTDKEENEIIIVLVGGGGNTTTF